MFYSYKIALYEVLFAKRLCTTVRWSE